MSDHQTIEPALSSEEWKRLLAYATGRSDDFGYVDDLVFEDQWAVLLALANHKLKDDDRRKITRERVNLLRALGTDMRGITLTPEQLNAELRSFADALASYLPPETP